MDEGWSDGGDEVVGFLEELFGFAREADHCVDAEEDFGCAGAFELLTDVGYPVGEEAGVVVPSHGLEGVGVGGKQVDIIHGYLSAGGENSGDLIDRLLQPAVLHKFHKAFSRFAHRHESAWKVIDLERVLSAAELIRKGLHLQDVTGDIAGIGNGCGSLPLCCAKTAEPGLKIRLAYLIAHLPDALSEVIEKGYVCSVPQLTKIDHLPDTSNLNQIANELFLSFTYFQTSSFFFYSHIFKNNGVDDYFCFGIEINPSINERNTILDSRERLILKDFIKKRKEIIYRIKSYKQRIKELDKYIKSKTTLTIQETSILFRDYYNDKTNKNYNIYYCDFAFINHSVVANVPRVVICEDKFDITKSNIDIIGKLNTKDFTVLVGDYINLYQMYLNEEDKYKKEIISIIINNMFKEKENNNVQRLK